MVRVPRQRAAFLLRERRKQKYGVAVLYTATLILLLSRSAPPIRDLAGSSGSARLTLDMGAPLVSNGRSLSFNNLATVAARSCALCSVCCLHIRSRLGTRGRVSPWDGPRSPALLTCYLAYWEESSRSGASFVVFFLFTYLLITLLSAATRATRPVVLGITLVQMSLRGFSIHASLEAH
jgi:hypothetical protein